MKTSYTCGDLIAVSTSDGEYVVVIGSDDRIDSHGYATTTIEIFHVRSKMWSELTSLPAYIPYPSATMMVFMKGTSPFPCEIYYPVISQPRHSRDLLP